MLQRRGTHTPSPMQGSHRPGSAEQSSTWGDPAAGWLAPGGMFGSCGGLRSAGSAASSCAGAAAGLEHCLSGDKENLVMRPHGERSGHRGRIRLLYEMLTTHALLCILQTDEVLGTAARSEREAQIISEAARFREEQPEMQPGGWRTFCASVCVSVAPAPIHPRCRSRSATCCCRCRRHVSSWHDPERKRATHYTTQTAQGGIDGNDQSAQAGTCQMRGHFAQTRQ